eukprot:3940441-Rhodomonas_salina.1
MSGTALGCVRGRCGTNLRACYAMSGTDYARAMQCLSGRGGCRVKGEGLRDAGRRAPGVGCRVQGVRLGTGCREQGVELRMSGVGSRVKGVGYRGVGSRVQVVGCRVSGVGCRMSDVGCR